MTWSLRYRVRFFLKKLKYYSQSVWMYSHEWFLKWILINVFDLKLLNTCESLWNYNEFNYVIRHFIAKHISIYFFRFLPLTTVSSNSDFFSFPNKGYEEPKDEIDIGINIQMYVSGILLIFSVAGSIYILKSYKVTTIIMKSVSFTSLNSSLYFSSML